MAQFKLLLFICVVSMGPLPIFADTPQLPSNTNSESAYEEALGDYYQLTMDLIASLPRAINGSIGVTSLSRDTMRSIFRKNGLSVNEVSAIENDPNIKYEFPQAGYSIRFENTKCLLVKNLLNDQGVPFNTLILIGHSDSISCSGKWTGINYGSDPRRFLPFHLEFFISLSEGQGLDGTAYPYAYHYNEKGALTYRYQRPGFGKPIFRIGINPRRMPIEQIYGSKDERMALAQTSGREIVAILDTGVDYNNSEIAYLLSPGLSNHDLQQIRNQFSMERNPVERSALEKVIESRGLGWDQVEQDSLPFDHTWDRLSGTSVFHGTAVAAASARDPRKVAILPIRFLGNHYKQSDFFEGKSVKSDIRDFEEMVLYAKYSGARIINGSFSAFFCRDIDKYLELSQEFNGHLTSQGGVNIARKNIENSNEYVKGIVEVIRRHSDILFVFSAGNGSADNAFSTLNTDEQDKFLVSNGLFQDSPSNLIRVGSVDKDGALSSFSYYGKRYVHLAALGKDVQLPTPFGTLEVSGTSFSAPAVASAVAEIWHDHPSDTMEGVFELLKMTLIKTEELEQKTMWGGYIAPPSLHP